MNELFDIFGIGDTTDGFSRYQAFGYPRNPFREAGLGTAGDGGPFYTGHIRKELKEIQDWVADVYGGKSLQPLSLVGNIGAGKSRILKYLRRHLSNLPRNRMVASDILLLSDTGFARASVGGTVLTAIERTPVPWAESPPSETNILPIVWAIVTSKNRPEDPNGPLFRALHRVQLSSSNTERIRGASLISRWLQRDYLSSKEAQTIGLTRRIDWEGELIHVIGDLLRYAMQINVLSNFFLFIDQLEDLFRPTFSELRRSRILTDLRGLVDEIDDGAPLGLCLAWTPDFVSDNRYPNNGVDAQFRRSYEALYARMNRRKVTLSLLGYDDALPFGKEWVESLHEEQGFNRQKQPDLAELVQRAWTELQRQKRLFPGGNFTATPRDLLTELASAVDRLVDE